jgi:hypothetical protein
MARRPIPVRQRIGIDLRPFGPNDPEGALWLNALVWPEHHDRRAELATALRIAAGVPLQLVAGDAVSVFDEVLRSVSPDCMLCISNPLVQSSSG